MYTIKRVKSSKQQQILDKDELEQIKRAMDQNRDDMVSSSLNKEEIQMIAELVFADHLFDIYEKSDKKDIEQIKEMHSLALAIKDYDRALRYADDYRSLLNGGKETMSEFFQREYILLDIACNTKDLELVTKIIDILQRDRIKNSAIAHKEDLEKYYADIYKISDAIENRTTKEEFKDKVLEVINFIKNDAIKTEIFVMLTQNIDDIYEIIEIINGIDYAILREIAPAKVQGQEDSDLRDELLASVASQLQDTQKAVRLANLITYPPTKIDAFSNIVTKVQEHQKVLEIIDMVEDEFGIVKDMIPTRVAHDTYYLDYVISEADKEEDILSKVKSYFYIDEEIAEIDVSDIDMGKYPNLSNYLDKKANITFEDKIAQFKDFPIDKSLEYVNLVSHEAIIKYYKIN